jgi:hypothetical protein
LTHTYTHIHIHNEAQKLSCSDYCNCEHAQMLRSWIKYALRNADCDHCAETTVATLQEALDEDTEWRKEYEENE